MKLILLSALLLSACGGSNHEVVPPKKVIVTIGDSTTAGAVSVGDTFRNSPSESYPAQLQKLLGDSATVHNLGINSSNLLEVYIDQVPNAVKLKPDVLVISTTLNDAGDSIWFAQLDYAYSSIKLQMPNARVIILTPTKEHISVTNISEYREYLLKRNDVLDIGKYSEPSWYCGNYDFHPCANGYVEIAKLVYIEILRK